MKALCSTIIALFLFTGVYAQEAAKDDSVGVAKLEIFLGNNVRPMAVAVENNVQGTVVVGFKIDSNRNIEGVWIIKSLVREQDLEVLRVFRMYHQPLALPPGEYSAGVGLLVNHPKSKGAVPPVDKSLYKNYLFDYIITADRRN